MIQKQAQKNARKCRVIPTLVWIAIIVITAAWAIVMRRPTLGTLLMLFNVLWLPRFVQGMLIKKYLKGAWDRGEYELYYESARALCLENERNLMYAEVLFYDGAYQRLINICTANIGELQAKKGKRKRWLCYYYLYHLARVYFRLADYQKLAKVCQAFRTRLQSEDGAMQKQLAPYQKILETYELYIQGDAPNVLAALDESDAKGGALEHGGNLLIRARVAAELQGDTAAAAELYTRVLQESPLQTHRDLAQKAIENLQQGLPYGYGNPELLPEQGYVLTKSAAFKRARRRGCALGVVMAILWLCSLLPTALGGGAGFDRLERDLESHCKRMNVLAAVQLQSKEEQGDYVYVGVEGKKVVLGTYRPADNEYFYFVRYDSIPKSQLLGDLPESEEVYCCDLEREHLIKGRFYADEQSIPQGCPYAAFKVRGVTRYYAVTSIAQLYAVYDGNNLVDIVVVDTTESEVRIQTSYAQGESTRIYLRELETVSLQTLTDASVTLEQKEFVSINGQYTYRGCFYRSVTDIPTDAYASYPILVGDQTYYYVILSIEQN